MKTNLECISILAPSFPFQPYFAPSIHIHACRSGQERKHLWASRDLHVINKWDEPIKGAVCVCVYVCVYVYVCVLMSVALSRLKLHDRRRAGGEKNDRSSTVVSLCKERERHWMRAREREEWEMQSLGGSCRTARHNNEFQISYSLQE